MRVDLSLPIRVAHVDVASQTTLEAAGADAVLVISTAVPELAFLMRTVYVGSGGNEPGAAIDVLLSREGRATTHRELAGVPVTHARGRCLSDHAGVVQDNLHRLTGEHISVHISDDAVETAGRTYPPADESAMT